MRLGATERLSCRQRGCCTVHAGVTLYQIMRTIPGRAAAAAATRYKTSHIALSA
jgi:hypothetical protein